MNEELKTEMEEVAESVVEPSENTEEDEILGTITVAVDVVSTIASMAVEEIKGVSAMYTSFAGGLAERLGAKKTPKGVKIEMKESSVVIDLYIVVDYGIKIPELAWEIQENVKNSVETMTGLDVEKVNIHVEGVNFEQEEQKLLEDEIAVSENDVIDEAEAPQEEIVTE